MKQSIKSAPSTPTGSSKTGHQILKRHPAGGKLASGPIQQGSITQPPTAPAGPVNSVSDGGTTSPVVGA